jgi:hypothetical protein
MGTALTGLEIKDTYDGLIKTTDNGPLSGTLKALSDGLGNDSTLSLSTTAASIAGTLAVTGNATFDTSTLFVDATNDRVGIGTGSPNRALSINGILGVAAATANTQQLLLSVDAAASYISSSYFGSSSYVPMFLEAGGAVRLAITTAGNVGIGTSTPATFGLLGIQATNAATKSAIGIGVGANGSNASPYTTAMIEAFSTGGTVPCGMYSINTYNDNTRNEISFRTTSTGGTTAERVRITADGLTFNGDTAAANALDDYEEGTWTPTFVGCTFTGTNVAKYTKIGNVVNVQLSFINQTIASASGAASITGLPFTASGFHAGSTNYADAFSTTDTSVRVGQGTNALIFNQNTSASDAVFNNGTTNRSLILSITYFV